MATFREVWNGILNSRLTDPIQALWKLWNGDTLAEIAAGVTPVNYAYLPDSPVIDVRRHGYSTAASGATNTAATNNASLVASQYGGGIVQLPPGAANLNGKLVGYAGVYVRGHGFDSTVLTQTHATDDVYMPIDVSRCGISQLRMNIGAGGHGIRWQAIATDPLHLLVRDVFINLANNSAGIGIWCDKPGARVLYWPFIENAIIQGGGYGTRVGIQFGTTGGSSIVVRPVVIGGRIYHLQTGIDLNRVSGARVYGTSLDDCQGGSGIGVRWRNATDCHVDIELETGVLDTYLQFDAAAAYSTAKIPSLAALPAKIVNNGNRCEVYGDDGSNAFINTAFAHPTSLLNIRKLKMNAGQFLLQRQTFPYSASITLQADSGNEFDITAINGAAFTLNAPTNPTDGQRITVTIRNTSGGALGVITWDAVFKMSTWTSPATGFNRSVDFLYNGTNWVQVSQTGVDVPN